MEKIQEQGKKMEEIQTSLLEFLNSESDSDETFQNPKDVFNNFNICGDKHNFKLFLQFILNISNDYNRQHSFFDKIEIILNLFKEDIKKNFTDKEIFNIFKSNKRILLYLFEEKIITIDDYIGDTITKNKYIILKYPQYFAPELKPLINEDWFIENKFDYINLNGSKENKWYDEINNELPENFQEKRKAGENDELICYLIRNDLLDDFIIYVNKNSFSIDSKIKPSIYETNSFLLNQNEASLIEYAVFFGSIQIFNYLKLQGVELTESLWKYAVHSNNAEIIHLIEACHIADENKTYKNCFKESIKCYHNDIADYIQNVYLTNDNATLQDKFSYAIEYINFKFMQDVFINETSFYLMCKFDYYSFVCIIINEITDINKIIIIYRNYLIRFY